MRFTVTLLLSSVITLTGFCHVCVLLQEYGITRDEKLLIGQCICTPLLRKILADFQRNAEEEEESTRLDSRWVHHWC